MWWRLPSKEFDLGAASNRAAMGALLIEGYVPGLLAYDGDEVVGWVSVAPRPQFGRVQRSRQVAPVDGEPAWSVVCFYVPRERRRQGVAGALLEAAVAYAADHGATLVEGYPVGDGRDHGGAEAVFSGTETLFRRSGFERVADRGGQRVVMRKWL